LLRLLLLIAEVPDIDTTIGHQHQNNQRLGGQHQSLSLFRFPQVSQFTSRNEVSYWQKYLAEKLYQILAACQWKIFAKGTLGIAIVPNWESQ